MKTILAALALLLFAAVSQADSIWTYSGNATSAPLANASNPCACSLSGTVTFDASFTALSWSFTDGQNTLTQLNSIGQFNAFWQNNPTVPFTTWRVFIDAIDGSSSLTTQYYGSAFEATDGGRVGSDYWSVQGNRGTWSDPVGTPEPSTLVLLGIAIVALLLKAKS